MYMSYISMKFILNLIINSEVKKFKCHVNFKTNSCLHMKPLFKP